VHLPPVAYLALAGATLAEEAAQLLDDGSMKELSASGLAELAG